MRSIFSYINSSSEDLEEINVAAECSFTESDKEEFSLNSANENKATWKIDFGL